MVEQYLKNVTTETIYISTNMIGSMCTCICVCAHMHTNESNWEHACSYFIVISTCSLPPSYLIFLSCQDWLYSCLWYPWTSFPVFTIIYRYLFLPYTGNSYNLYMHCTTYRTKFCKTWSSTLKSTVHIFHVCISCQMGILLIWLESHAVLRVYCHLFANASQVSPTWALFFPQILKVSIQSWTLHSIVSVLQICWRKFIATKWDVPQVTKIRFSPEIYD